MEAAGSFSPSAAAALQASFFYESKLKCKLKWAPVWPLPIGAPICLPLQNTKNCTEKGTCASDWK